MTKVKKNVIQSRIRTQANEACKTLTDSNNVSDFAHYLAHYGFMDKAISNYCHAIKNLVHDSYFSRNRKLFFAYDSVAEYSSAILDTPMALTTSGRFKLTILMNR